MRQLTVLDLSCNQLARVPDAIGRLVHLRTLNLSQNCISALPQTLRQCVVLERLQLCDNRLYAVDCALLLALPSLSFLDLRCAFVSILVLNIKQLKLYCGIPA